MTGPPWLAAVLAAVMILTAACSASRLVVARRRALATEADADALHAVMGTAMAGMLLPQLNLLPATAWAVIFAVAAAWFAGRALRAPGASKPGRPGCFQSRTLSNASRCSTCSCGHTARSMAPEWRCLAWVRPPAHRQTSQPSRSC